MAKRERNRDRERTRIREEWELENKARAGRGEEPLPESEIDRQLDEEERLQSQELNHDDGHRRPEHRDAPPTQELTPGGDNGESHWNDPENVKNAIHYFEHERPRDREQQQAIADELDKEREESAMQQDAERIQESRIREDDAGEILRRNRAERGDSRQEPEPEQDQSYNRDDAGEVLRRNRAEREARNLEQNRDLERDHDIEHDR